MGLSFKTWCFTFGARRWQKKEKRAGWDLTWSLPIRTGRYSFGDTTYQRPALRWHLGKLEIESKILVSAMAQPGVGNEILTRRAEHISQDYRWGQAGGRFLGVCPWDTFVSSRTEFKTGSVPLRWALDGWELWKRCPGWWEDGPWLGDHTELSDLSDERYSIIFWLVGF